MTLSLTTPMTNFMTNFMTHLLPFHGFAKQAAILCLAAMPLAAMPAAVHAQAAEQSVGQTARQLRVTGTGEVFAEPDMATVTLGVVSEAETAADALAQNSETMSEIIAALKAARIAARDLATSNFSIQPKFIYPDKTRGDQGEPRIVGYTVRNSLTVRIRELARTGEILDAMVSLGSNAISGVSFGLDDTGPVMERARGQAVADARARAELYADAAGVALGDILLITEPQSRGPGPAPYARTTSIQAEARPVPVEGGELTFSASLDVVWEILPK